MAAAPEPRPDPGRRVAPAPAIALVALLAAGPAVTPAGAAEPAQGALPAPEQAAVAALNFAPQPLDPAFNRAELTRRLREAHARGARYLVTPELGLTGEFAEGMTAEALRDLAEPIPGPTTEHFARLARELGAWIGISLLETRPDSPNSSDVYITAVLLDDSGRTAALHRRIMVRPDGPEGLVTRGDYRAILDTVPDGDLRLGILSGSDVQVGVARLADRGADLILICSSPGALAGGDGLARRYSVQLASAERTAPGTGVRAGGIFSRSGGYRRPSDDGLALAPLDMVPHRWRPASALGLPASVPVPAHEPASALLRELGRRLFFDPGMSRSGTVSCATCHEPERAFTNGSAKGQGVFGRHTKRNVPTLLNVAFKPLLRWDGYASMLENFAKYPLSGYNEMSFHYLDEVVDYVKSRPVYVRALLETMDLARADEIEFEHVARALATFQRSLVSGNSAFDRYQYGGDHAALSPSAARGLALFRGKADCERCHQIGPNYALFMDLDYHFLGIGYEESPGASPDIGLGSISTNDLAGLFQTPSLRDVARTAPYMHDGSIGTLEDVIEFFDRGGTPAPGRPVELKPLGLSAAEKRDLVEFLRSLDGDWDYGASAGSRTAAR